MGWCAAPNCSQGGSYRFPKDPALRRKWELALHRGEDFKSTPYTRLCKNHFKTNDFIVSKVIGRKPKKTHLKRKAIPSIFMNPFGEEICNVTKENKKSKKRTKNNNNNTSQNVDDSKEIEKNERVKKITADNEEVSESPCVVPMSLLEPIINIETSESSIVVKKSKK